MEDEKVFERELFKAPNDKKLIKSFKTLSITRNSLRNRLF